MKSFVPVKGFEGYYINKKGDVLSKVKAHGRVLTRREQVVLSLEGKRHYISVGRLVWLSFKGPIPGNKVIINKNGDRTDNRLINLELRHKGSHLGKAKKNPLSGSANGKAILNEEKAALIYRSYHNWGCTQTSLAERYGVSQKCISLICRGETWREATNGQRNG